jgi:serine/threonine protein kinase
MAEGTLAGVQRRLTDDLGGAYQIVRLLGQGAFGAVYLARDRILHRLVAIKVLRLERAASETERARFRLEARTAALLDHPSIAPILSFVETPTTLYMLMPYIGGESLAQRIQKSGRLQPTLVRHVLREVSAALAHAHRIGVVHRDLKPENVLLTPGDDISVRASAPAPLPRVRLVDFGIAAFPNRDLGAGIVREHGGTPNFMSPEQALGESDFGPKTDIYALGVLGYLMLAGRLPFVGANLTARVAEQRKGPPVPLAKAAPRAPSDLVVAIDRCLEFDPVKRWRNVREFHAALSTEMVWQRSGPRALFARLVARIRGRQALAARRLSAPRADEALRGDPRANESQVGSVDMNISQVGLGSAVSQVGADSEISQGGRIDPTLVGRIDPNASLAGNPDPNARQPGAVEPSVSSEGTTDSSASQSSANVAHAPGSRPTWRKDQ